MNAQPLLDYIKKYVNLTQVEESILLSKLNYRRNLKNQFVVQQEDVCVYESFVLGGCLRTFYSDSQGQEHTVMFAIENWWVGD